MTTLKEKLEAWNVDCFQKDDCFSRDKQDAILKAIKEWLSEKKQPIEGMQMRNNVKGLLVLQGQQQMIQTLLKELE